MLSRRKLFAGALLFVLLLLANAVYFARATPGNVLRRLAPAWTAQTGAVQSLVRTTLQAGQGPVLVVAGSRGVTLVGDDGTRRPGPKVSGMLVALATGDLSGDGIDEIVTLTRAGAETSVSAFDGDSKLRWSTPIATTAEPARVLLVDLDRDRHRDVVLAFQGGSLQALTSDGRASWTWEPADSASGEDGQVRGLDDLKLSGGVRRVAMASRDGLIVILDGHGQTLWSERQPTKVRRLRVAELGDGSSSVLIGREDGVCWRLREQRATPPAFAGELFTRIGETITEIRAVESDGNPATREVALGGKGGLVLLMGGQPGSVRAKISALIGADADGDGRDELLVGSEAGEVHLLDDRGEILASLFGQGKPEAFAAIPGGAGRLLVVGGNQGLSAYRYAIEGAPFWYHPALAALVGLLGLAVVLLTLARLPPLPVAEAPRIDVPGARRARLEQAWRKVTGLMEGGQAIPADAQERLDQLRSELEASDREALQAARPLVKAPPPPRRET